MTTQTTVARPIVYATSTDEELIKVIEHFASFPQEIQIHDKEYLEDYKNFTNIVRKSLSEEYSSKVIGFILEKNKDGVVVNLIVTIYDIESTNDNHYVAKIDKDGIPYIEVEEGVIT